VKGRKGKHKLCDGFEIRNVETGIMDSLKWRYSRRIVFEVKRNGSQDTAEQRMRELEVDRCPDPRTKRLAGEGTMQVDSFMRIEAQRWKAE
jgi:hypothetical protein